MAKGGGERGMALVFALMMLLLFSLLAVAALETSRIEGRIVRSRWAHRRAFVAAESGIAYVAARPDLCGPGNTDQGQARDFSLDPTGSLSFSGSVTYMGAQASGPLLRGTGYSVGAVRAHLYRIDSTGTTPDGGRRRVEAEAIRIGF